MEKKFSFSDLINGLSYDKFFNLYWEKKVLYLKRDNPCYYQSLFNETDLNPIIWTSNFPWGKIQLANHNKSANYKNYTNLPPNLITLTQAFHQGDTIVVNDLQEKLTELALLCRSIFEEFNFLSNINLYLTKNDHQGLSPHYDDEDVFILQISGRKKWMIYDSPVSLPLNNNIRSPATHNYDLIKEEYIIEAGDLLYLPRGTGHAAQALPDTSSMHLTLSVTVIRWCDILSTLLQLSSETDEDFRRSIPIKQLFSPSNQFQHLTNTTLQNLLLKLIKNADGESLVRETIDVYKHRFIQSLKPINDKFITDSELNIENNTRLRKRLGVIMHYQIINEDLHVFFLAAALFVRLPF